VLSPVSRIWLVSRARSVPRAWPSRMLFASHLLLALGGGADPRRVLGGWGRGVLDISFIVCLSLCTRLMGSSIYVPLLWRIPFRGL